MVTTKNANDSRTSYLEQQITFLRTVIAGLVGLLTVGFGAGILWNTAARYEQTVDLLKTRVKALEGELVKTAKATKAEIDEFKVNLGNIETPTYQIEAASDGPDGGQCTTGNVVTGVHYVSNKLYVRCASLGRAAFDPTGGRGMRERVAGQASSQVPADLSQKTVEAK
jgi:hypothetical protein